jgi:23S rRNA (cytosine1962-C5)-methyltransferase
MSQSPRARVVLARGRERSVARRHPWVFSGAVARIDGAPEPGDLVEVVDARGASLGSGFVNPRSQIVVRMTSFAPDPPVDEARLDALVLAAIARRDASEPAQRLIFGESDALPGLIADRFGDVLVLQATTAGIDRRKRALAERLLEATGARCVWERSDADVRAKEGLASVNGLLSGESPPDLVEVVETACDGSELVFLADVRGGQKTGHFLDQRLNRARVASLAAGRGVLDIFSYTGAFALHALRGGASAVSSVDSSEAAHERARHNLERNGEPPERVERVRADAFDDLRARARRGERHGVVVLDPPKLARSTAGVRGATRAYKDLNLHALRCVEPGGHLATFSCSGLVSADLFQKIVFGAALDARVDARIVGWFHQPSDHPVLVTFPESAYLKGLLLRVE